MHALKGSQPAAASPWVCSISRLLLGPFPSRTELLEPFLVPSVQMHISWQYLFFSDQFKCPVLNQLDEDVKTRSKKRKKKKKTSSGKEPFRSLPILDCRQRVKFQGRKGKAAGSRAESSCLGKMPLGMCFPRCICERSGGSRPSKSKVMCSGIFLLFEQ